MKNILAAMAISFAAAAHAAYVRQATEEYPSGGGGGGVTTNAVKTIINAEVGGTNTLVHTPQIANFVTKAVTNGLASQTWVEDKKYVTKSVTNGLVSAERATAIADAEIVAKGAVLTNSEGFASTLKFGDGTQNITISDTGLWSNDSRVYLTQGSLTLANSGNAEIKVDGNDIVYGVKVNGGSEQYGHVELDIPSTNGLASEAWVNAKKYVTEVVTNGLATTNYVIDAVSCVTNAGLPASKLAITNGVFSFDGYSVPSTAWYKNPRKYVCVTPDMMMSYNVSAGSMTNAVYVLPQGLNMFSMRGSRTSQIMITPSTISQNDDVGDLEYNTSIALNTNRIEFSTTDYSIPGHQKLSYFYPDNSEVATSNMVNRIVGPYTNQAPDYANVSNKAVTALQTHQSLAWSNDYRRVDAKINWADVTNHGDFVTESVTNGILVAARQYADASTNAAVASADAFAKKYTDEATNKLERISRHGAVIWGDLEVEYHTGWYPEHCYLSETRRYNTPVWVSSNTRWYCALQQKNGDSWGNIGGGWAQGPNATDPNAVDIQFPNGKPTHRYVYDTFKDKLATTNELRLATADLAKTSITNGFATETWVTNRNYATASVTNGLATVVAATNIAYAVVTNAVDEGYLATEDYAHGEAQYVKNQLNTRINQVTNRVGQVEAYLGGQNVRVSVTNVNGSAMGDLPKLRIEENVSNVWNIVWDEDTKYGTWYTNATSAVAAMTNSVRHDVHEYVTNAVASKAPLAWGTVTSAGGPAPANTVWHTAGKTVFGGGTEFQLVAVGTGQIGVLVNKGSVVYAEGNPGTFFFETEDFRYHFGMRVEDSYMLGCNTDGITVTQVAGGNLVTLTYNVTMTGKPCLYYKASLATTNAWEKLNDSTGTPIPGASKVISWEATPPAGKEICYIPCGTDGQGFFTACVEVAGKQTFETNLAIDPQGGILATNETLNVMTAIEPYISGGEVKWRIKP